MRLFCAGFNLYGQYRNLHEICIETFKNTHFDNLIDLETNQLFSIAKEHAIDTETPTKNHAIKTVFHGSLNGKRSQIKELFFEIGDVITQFSLSDNNALFLTSKGKIWSLKYTNESIFHIVPLPNFAQIETNDEIVQIACGHTINCASTNNGSIYNIPSKLDCTISNIKHICCGREHCLILTGNGLVYSFGGGSRGQLGHGDVEDLTEPKLVDGLGGINIVKIACGGWHSVAVSSEGDAYVWGWNSNGQLGLKTNGNDDVAIMASPQVIQFDINVSAIACGSRHTIALLENSKLFGCGWNKYCQLGFKSSDENVHSMIQMYDFSNMKVIDLKCGTWSSAVLISD